MSTTEIFHVTRIGETTSPVVDPWHYTGNSAWHGNSINREFIDRCKAILPKRSLAIHVGPTGYVEPIGKIEPTHAWTEDSLGRFVCVLGDMLVFQRFTEGDSLIVGLVTGNSYTNLVDNDMLVELNIRLNRYRDATV
jgi:hypothetical protein